MVVRWKPEVTVKDAIQICVMVIGLVYLVSQMQTATAVNTETNAALRRILDNHETRIDLLEDDQRYHEGYDAAIRDQAGAQ